MCGPLHGRGGRENRIKREKSWPRVSIIFKTRARQRIKSENDSATTRSFSPQLYSQVLTNLHKFSACVYIYIIYTRELYIFPSWSGRPRAKDIPRTSHHLLTIIWEVLYCFAFVFLRSPLLFVSLFSPNLHI